MNRLKSSGFKGLNPLTPAVLDLRIGIYTSVFNGLLKSSKSSWILALELRLKQKNQHFCGVQDHFLSPAVLLPLTGVSGSDQRLRLVTPSWPMSSAPPIYPTQKPGGDASDQERHRHPHQTASKGEAIWINRV